MSWIDTHHAFENLGGPTLKEAWEKIQEAHDGEVVLFKLEQAGVVASSVGEFCLNVAPKNPNNKEDPLMNRKNQLLYAWIVITEEFEKAQGESWLSWKVANQVGGLVKKLQIDQQPSTFSTEDLVSNLIFFYTIIDGVKRYEVDKLAGKFDPQDEPNLSIAIWKIGFKTRSGHTTWMDPQYLTYEQFVQLPQSWGPFADESPQLALMWVQANELLFRKYKARYGPPDFPDYFETYHPTTEGYIRIEGKNMWKNYPGLPEVKYWHY